MPAPHPDLIRFYMNQHKSASYGQIKRLLRLGYHYPVQLQIKYGQDALGFIRDIKGDDGACHAIVIPRWRWSFGSTVIVWFRDQELATIVKLVAG